MKAKNFFVIFALLFFVAGMFGCASSQKANPWLQSSHQSNETPWTLAEFEKIFDEQITVGHTSAKELRKMLITDETPNVDKWDTITIERAFAPSGDYDGAKLPNTIAQAIDHENECYALAINLMSAKKYQEGSFWKNKLDFEKRERVTGYNKTFIIVLVQDLVVWKSDKGVKNVNVLDVQKNRLGPLKNLKPSELVEDAYDELTDRLGDDFSDKYEEKFNPFD